VYCCGSTDVGPVADVGPIAVVSTPARAAAAAAAVGAREGYTLPQVENILLLLLHVEKVLMVLQVE
jgi:hypothetical protein